MPLDCTQFPAECAEQVLCDALARFAGRIALVSSFGAESAVLLHMVAGIDRSTPVIFLDTGKLFPETLAYRDQLVAQIGLLDVRSRASLIPRASRSSIPPARCGRAIPISAAGSARSSRSTRRSTASMPGSPGASATRRRRGGPCR